MPLSIFSSEGAVEGWLHYSPQDQTNFSSEGLTNLHFFAVMREYNVLGFFLVSSIFRAKKDASIYLSSCLCTIGSSSSEEEYGVHEVTSSDYARMKKPCLSSHQKEELKDGYCGSMW